MSAQTPFLVFSGTNSRYLAEKICNSLGCPLGQMNIQHFADGEFSVSYEESIRGRDVFLVQSTFPNADNLMELLLMIDAAKRASAHSIIAVIPYFGWARQDRKDKRPSCLRTELQAAQGYPNLSPRHEGIRGKRQERQANRPLLQRLLPPSYQAWRCMDERLCQAEQAARPVAYNI